MLILTRKPGESLYIGDIKVMVVEIKGSQIRIGIDAPSHVRIYREEIYVQIQEENRSAAQGAVEAGLEGLSKAFSSSDQQKGLSSKLGSLKISGNETKEFEKETPIVMRRKRRDDNE